MAKGKEALLSARRRVLELEEQLESSEYELGQLQQANAKLTRTLVDQGQLKSEVTRLRGLYSDGVSDLTISLEAKVETQRRTLRHQRKTLKKRTETMDALLKRLAVHTGSHEAALDELLTEMDGEPITILAHDGGLSRKQGVQGSKHRGMVEAKRRRAAKLADDRLRGGLG